MYVLNLDAPCPGTAAPPIRTVNGYRCIHCGRTFRFILRDRTPCHAPALPLLDARSSALPLMPPSSPRPALRIV